MRTCSLYDLLKTFAEMNNERDTRTRVSYSGLLSFAVNGVFFPESDTPVLNGYFF